MQSLSVPHAGSGGLSWQRAALTAAADVGALAAISGGFVASLYVWREARGPLCALLPSVGLPEAATNLRYYYDRDHPSNIAKRCLSIAVVAVAGVGYLVFDEMRAARRGGAALRLATSASAGASASSFLSTFADASLSVLRRHFVGSGATRHIGAAAFVTATLFAGVIATKVFFPSERGALPDDSSSDESEATSELEGDGEDAVGGGNAYDRREGGDTYVNASGGGRRQRGRRSGAAAADGGEYESSSITAADGARGGGAFATSASSATSISNNNNNSSGNSSSSGGETPRRRVAATNTRASLVSNNPFSRGATEMGAGTIRPLRVDRDASRGLRAFKTRRRRWQIMRNLVFAPFVEELIFRAVMLRVIRGGAENNATSSEIGEFRYPPSALYALLATGFSLAHLHHIVLNSVRAYQQSFDPLEPEAAQTSAAWARGAKVTGAQLAMTAVFTYLNTFIYRTVAGENVIAAAIAHSLCNYLGPPSLAYLSFYPTPPSPAASSSSSSTGLSFSDEKGSAAQSDKKKKGGLKGLVSRIKGCAKAVCVRLQPSRVSHATKLRAISVSYGCGIVGFLGLVVAFRRRAAS